MGMTGKPRERCVFDANKIGIFGARRADITGSGAWQPLRRGTGIAKINRKRETRPR
jgi:hypothetical protein